MVVKNALPAAQAGAGNQRLKEGRRSSYRIIGESVPMKALRQQLGLMAGTNGRVLIFGESGTGKELVAHAMHQHEPARQGAFRRSELRGHSRGADRKRAVRARKGSFAGASEDKTGKLQKADGGTLFLDEVGDMSLQTQAKVLRALEEQRFEPVGADDSIKVDVRVVAATNKNLEEEIEARQFSRGSVLPAECDSVFCAAAARAAEDIPLLADHFLQRVHHRLWAQAQGADPGAYRVLRGLPLAGQCARIEQPDRAHRDHESAGADGRAPHSASSRADGRCSSGPWIASAVCRKYAKRPSANISSRSSKKRRAMSPAPRNCSAWSAAISIAR